MNPCGMIGFSVAAQGPWKRVSDGDKGSSDWERVASIKKDTEGKIAWQIKARGGGPEQTSPEVDGGAAVCSDPG